MSADFAAVDAGDAREHVSMMDATDAWPAVQAARAWVLARAEIDGGLVVDIGCGPGTFGGAAATAGAFVVDLDASLTMLRTVQQRHRGARPVLADAARLPLRDGAARLVRAERVLQWMPDPYAALAGARRVTAPGGWTAVTDTDWGTLAVVHPDSRAADRITAAALGWVPHARLARGLERSLVDLGATEVHARADTVTIEAWDPDDPAQHDGPPGLPLHSIAAGGAPADQLALAEDLAVLAEHARRGQFAAALTLVTVMARR
jgi:SAM-dependent methyltransferase